MSSELGRKSLDPRSNPLLGQMLAEAATVMIWIADLDKQCIYFNNSWLSFRCRTTEQEYGFAWAEGVHPEDFDTCIKIYNEAFDSRQAFSMDYR
jgi:PAS domain-containing protein